MIIVRGADLSEFVALIFVGKMCVFVSRPMKIVTFPRKKPLTLQKRVVDFPRERDTFRNKIMEIVDDFDENSYHNNGKPWKSWRILRVNPFFHFSFSFMFFHVLSFSFMFFHFLSFSFIFFHFSFIFFVGCSKSVFFWGLNFVTISLDNSNVKNQFLGPSRVVTPLGHLLPFFPTFFFSRFLSFFFFYFFVFSFFFCSFLHFLIFECFSFSCFSFFLYFFQIFFLLALVSEFNCFLRSRCSMEMWCPDDIGRDSWDWVGPPAWGRACFNSPEWSGGSSPVKTEPPQIVLLLLLCVMCLCVVCCCVVLCAVCCELCVVYVWVCSCVVCWCCVLLRPFWVARSVGVATGCALPLTCANVNY